MQINVFQRYWMDSYKVLNPTKWASMMAVTRPANVADLNRLITTGILLGAVAPRKH